MDAAMQKIYDEDPYGIYLNALWEDAMPAAARQLRLSRKYDEDRLSEAERESVHALAGDLVDQWVAQDHGNVRVQRMLNTHHDQLLQGLQDIKQAVDRSAVAANAVDLAQRHPFLSGFLGTWLIDKITGK